MARKTGVQRAAQKMAFGDEFVAMMPIIMEYRFELAVLKEVRAARKVGAKAIAKAAGIPWIGRIIPPAACGSEMADVLLALSPSTFAQTFPKDREVCFMDGWAELVARSGQSKVWMAHNAIDLMRDCGGLIGARDVADYVGSLPALATTKKRSVVMKESVKWHNQPDPLPVFCDTENRAFIGVDLGAREATFAVRYGTAMHDIVSAFGQVSGFFQETPPPLPEGISAGPEAYRYLVQSSHRFGRGEWDHSGCFRYMGIPVSFDRSLAATEIVVRNTNSHSRNRLAGIQRAIEDDVFHVTGKRTSTRADDGESVAYPFQKKLPILYEDTQLILLTSWNDLQEETRLMNHCVGRGLHGPSYWERVKAFKTMIGSARRFGHEMPMATIEFGMDGSVKQIRGHSNNEPKSRDIPFIWALIERFRAIDMSKYDFRAPAKKEGLLCIGGSKHGQHITPLHGGMVKVAPPTTFAAHVDIEAEYVEEAIPYETYSRRRIDGREFLVLDTLSEQEGRSLIRGMIR